MRRVYRCKLCGWTSGPFGSKTRIYYRTNAHLEVERHFAEKHPEHLPLLEAMKFVKVTFV
jgi:hypothetical protein